MLGKSTHCTVARAGEQWHGGDLVLPVDVLLLGSRKGANTGCCWASLPYLPSQSRGQWGDQGVSTPELVQSCVFHG